MNIFLIILASYIVHIFGCRWINHWMMENKHHDRTGNDYWNAVGAWFIPVFGALYIIIFAIRLLILKDDWKMRPIWKWFSDGEEFKIKKNDDSN